MRLLKFDSIHPGNFLNKKKEEWGPSYKNWNKTTYYNELISLRANFSDFYSFYLNQKGWVAEEFFTNDPDFLIKIEKELFGDKSFWLNKARAIRKKIGFNVQPWKLHIISSYINFYRPDIIFCRERTSIPSSFWGQFRDTSLLVARLSAPLPANWSPLDFDVIYTDIPVYQDFFSFNNVKLHINNNGFDERILDEITIKTKIFDLSFVGGLGGNEFKERTHFFEQIAEIFGDRFFWWGYKMGTLSNRLESRHQGITAGKETFQIYKDSKIVLNDYIDIARNKAVNQRIYEVLGVGTFMLTRFSESLWEKFPRHSIATFNDLTDCKNKILYYLSNEKEREETAIDLQKIVLQQYNYRNMVDKLSDELEADYREKFPTNLF